MAEADCRLRNKLMATLRQSRTRLSRSWIELSILPSCVIPAFCEGGICHIFIRGDEIPVKLLRLEYHGQAMAAGDDATPATMADALW